ncbi:hypothetical protein [Schwartzia sp. (in: firmicutes)]
MKTSKWMNGLCALAVGAAVLGTAMPYASAYDGALNGDGPHKYDVRRGAYEQEGGSTIKVKPGRYKVEEPEPAPVERPAEKPVPKE